MIPWMWDVALFDALAAGLFFLIAWKVPSRWQVRCLLLVAAAWCLIEMIGHAAMENAVAEVLR